LIQYKGTEYIIAVNYNFSMQFSIQAEIFVESQSEKLMVKNLGIFIERLTYHSKDDCLR